MTTKRTWVPMVAIAGIAGGTAWLVLTSEAAHAGVPKQLPNGTPYETPETRLNAKTHPPLPPTPRALERGRRPAPAQPATDPTPAPEIPTPTVFPTRIDEVPMTQWRREQLSALNPQDVELLDYKLGFLSELRACLASEHPELNTLEGEIEFFAHFRIEPGARSATATSVDLLNSTTAAEADAGFLACANLVHRGRALQSEHFSEGKTDFHWATSVRFPLERDNAYLFFVK